MKYSKPNIWAKLCETLKNIVVHHDTGKPNNKKKKKWLSFYYFLTCETKTMKSEEMSQVGYPHKMSIYIILSEGNYCTAAEDKEEVKDVDEITCAPLWCRWSIEMRENKQGCESPPPPHQVSLCARVWVSKTLCVCVCVSQFVCEEPFSN